MEEVVSFDLFLNVNSQGFNKTNTSGFLLINENNVEGYINGDFIFGTISDGELVIYRLFDNFDPIKYIMKLDYDGVYRGKFFHQKKWYGNNNITGGLVQISNLEHISSNLKKTRLIKKKISTLKESLNRYNNVFYQELASKDRVINSSIVVRKKKLSGAII